MASTVGHGSFKGHEAKGEVQGKCGGVTRHKYLCRDGELSWQRGYGRCGSSGDIMLQQMTPPRHHKMGPSTGDNSRRQGQGRSELEDAALGGQDQPSHRRLPDRHSPPKRPRQQHLMHNQGHHGHHRQQQHRQMQQHGHQQHFPPQEGCRLDATAHLEEHTAMKNEHTEAPRLRDRPPVFFGGSTHRRHDHQRSKCLPDGYREHEEKGTEKGKEAELHGMRSPGEPQETIMEGDHRRRRDLESCRQRHPGDDQGCPQGEDNADRWRAEGQRALQWGRKRRRGCLQAAQPYAGCTRAAAAPKMAAFDNASQHLREQWHHEEPEGCSGREEEAEVDKPEDEEEEGGERGEEDLGAFCYEKGKEDEECVKESPPGLFFESPAQPFDHHRNSERFPDGRRKRSSEETQHRKELESQHKHYHGVDDVEIEAAEVPGSREEAAEEEKEALLEMRSRSRCSAEHPRGCGKEGRAREQAPRRPEQRWQPICSSNGSAETNDEAGERPEAAPEAEMPYAKRHCHQRSDHHNHHRLVSEELLDRSCLRDARDTREEERPGDRAESRDRAEASGGDEVVTSCTYPPESFDGLPRRLHSGQDQCNIHLRHEGNRGDSDRQAHPREERGGAAAAAEEEGDEETKEEGEVVEAEKQLHHEDLRLSDHHRRHHYHYDGHHHHSHHYHRDGRNHHHHHCHPFHHDGRHPYHRDGRHHHSRHHDGRHHHHRGDKHRSDSRRLPENRHRRDQAESWEEDKGRSPHYSLEDEHRSRGAEVRSRSSRHHRRSDETNHNGQDAVVGCMDSEGRHDRHRHHDRHNEQGSSHRRSSSLPGSSNGLRPVPPGVLAKLHELYASGKFTPQDFDKRNTEFLLKFSTPFAMELLENLKCVHIDMQWAGNRQAYLFCTMTRVECETMTNCQRLHQNRGGATRQHHGMRVPPACGVPPVHPEPLAPMSPPLAPPSFAHQQQRSGSDHCARHQDGSNYEEGEVCLPGEESAGGRRLVAVYPEPGSSLTRAGTSSQIGSGFERFIAPSSSNQPSAQWQSAYRPLTNPPRPPPPPRKEPEAGEARGDASLCSSRRMNSWTQDFRNTAADVVRHQYHSRVKHEDEHNSTSAERRDLQQRRPSPFSTDENNGEARRQRRGSRSGSYAAHAAYADLQHDCRRHQQQQMRRRSRRSSDEVQAGNYMDADRTRQQPFPLQLSSSTASSSPASSSSHFSLHSGAQGGASEPLQESWHLLPSNLRQHHCWSSDEHILRTTSPLSWKPSERGSLAHTRAPSVHHHHHHHDTCQEGPYTTRQDRKQNSSIKMGAGACSSSDTRPADHARAEGRLEEIEEGRIWEQRAVFCNPKQDVAAPLTKRMNAECAEASFTGLPESDSPSRTKDAKGEPVELPQAGGQNCCRQKLPGPEDAGHGLMRPHKDLKSARTSQLAKMILDARPALTEGGWFRLGNGAWSRLARDLIQWGFERRERCFDDSPGSNVVLDSATKKLHMLLDWLVCVLDPFPTTLTQFVIGRLRILVREAATCQSMGKYHRLRAVLSPDSDIVAALRWCYTFFSCLRKEMLGESVQMDCGDSEMETTSGSPPDTRKVLGGDQKAGVAKIEEATHSIPVPKPEVLTLLHPAASACLDDDEDDHGGHGGGDGDSDGDGGVVDNNSTPEALDMSLQWPLRWISALKYLEAYCTSSSSTKTALHYTVFEELCKCRDWLQKTVSMRDNIVGYRHVIHLRILMRKDSPGRQWSSAHESLPKPDLDAIEWCIKHLSDIATNGALDEFAHSGPEPKPEEWFEIQKRSTRPLDDDLDENDDLDDDGNVTNDNGDDDDDDDDDDDRDDSDDGTDDGDDDDLDGDGDDGDDDSTGDDEGDEILDRSAQPWHLRCIAILKCLKARCISRTPPKPALNIMVLEELGKFQKRLMQTVSMMDYRDLPCIRRLILRISRQPKIYLKPDVDDIEWCINRLSHIGNMASPGESGAAATMMPPAAPIAEPPPDPSSPRPQLPRCMKTPPWLRLPSDLGQRVLQSCGINLSGSCTVIVTMRKDIGNYPGSMKYPREHMEKLLENGYWTRVQKHERACLVLQESQARFQQWQKLLSQGSQQRTSLENGLVESAGQTGGSSVTCFVDFTDTDGEQNMLKSLTDLSEVTIPIRRTSHWKGGKPDKAKLHAGWGKLGMAGMTFRPGNGVPGHCCGLWKYVTKKGVPAERLDDIMESNIEQLDRDWRWLEGTLPRVAEELSKVAEGIDNEVQIGEKRQPAFMGKSFWCCMSIGENYYAAPHTDRIDKVGALVRFAGHCSIKSNEFYLPELGVVIETPPMCVLWCQTDLVVHGTMAPDGGITRYATARMLKRNVINKLRKIQRDAAAEELSRREPAPDDSGLRGEESCRAADDDDSGAVIPMTSATAPALPASVSEGEFRWTSAE